MDKLQQVIEQATAWVQGTGPAPVDHFTLLIIAASLGACAVWLLTLVMFRSRKTDAKKSSRRDVGVEPDHGMFGSATEALASQIPESEQETSDFHKLLRQAGLYRRSAGRSIYAMRFVLLLGAVIVTAIAAILAPSELTLPIVIAGGLSAAALSIVPRLYVFFRRKSRLQEIRNGLPDMIDMLSMCMGGGMSISASLEHVSKNLRSYPALSQELAIVRRQADIGSLKLALTDFANRMDIPEVRQVCHLLQRSETLGSQVSTSLLEQSDHLRTARRQMATMQANKTPVKLTLPLMLCFAPAALILLISPAVLELHDFLYPQSGQSLLSGNSTLNPTVMNLNLTLDELNRDVPVFLNRPDQDPEAAE